MNLEIISRRIYNLILIIGITYCIIKFGWSKWNYLSLFLFEIFDIQSLIKENMNNSQKGRYQHKEFLPKED